VLEQWTSAGEKQTVAQDLARKEVHNQEGSDQKSDRQKEGEGQKEYAE
jgi:hypothetical protein